MTAAPKLPMLDGLPGIPDVVWGTLARLEGWRDPVRLLVASAEPRAGASVIAAATAIGLLRHLRVPVCLVETNVEHPAVARYLGLREVGLSDVLDGRATLDDCIQQPKGEPNLFVLPAGTPRAAVPGEFTTEAMRSILEGLGSRGRYLVVDAPPLLAHIESRMLLQQVDGALLVLRAGATRVDDAERAHKILLQSGVAVIGSIFNAFQAERPLGRSGVLEKLWSRLRRRGDDLPEVDLPALPPEARPAVRASLDEPPMRSDAGAATNGAPLVAASASEEELRRQVDLLERRIAKLTRLLKQSEENLRRMAALKNVDPGIASIYRGVQGLSSEEEEFVFKRQLMQKIFQANLELKHAVARLS